jgi:thiosulfate/3-mercaptopyruvate sulfurtransferase
MTVREVSVKRAVLGLLASMLVTAVCPGGVAHAAETAVPPQAPIVSSTWLESQATTPNLVVIDTRSADEYEAGHIPNSVSIPFATPVSAWSAARNGLTLELPEASELFGTLGDAGVTRSSRVVVVTGANDPPYAQAGGTRVAMTLMHAGLSGISILDGGYPKWVADHKATTTDVPRTVPAAFDGAFGHVRFVGTDDVHAAVGRTTIVDARAANVYSGEVVEPFATKAGHIPSAVSVPTPSLFNADGTYKTSRQLASIVEAAVGGDRGKEIIVYCGVGGYATTTLFVLTRVLGYQNVRFYDGSAQEWVTRYDMELPSAR